MKRLVIILTAVMMLLPLTAFAASVRGHMRDTNRDGIKDTYVQPHQRTSPNSSRTDNYSYPGNYNPNRGEITPSSQSPRELYPSNPSPYETKRQEPGLKW
jgi:hypothetical protein